MPGTKTPGPYVQHLPLGFPTFSKKRQLVWRRANNLAVSELDNLASKYILSNLGLKYNPPAADHRNMKRYGPHCLAYGTRRVDNYFQLSKQGLNHMHREGWLEPYGLDFDRR